MKKIYTDTQQKFVNKFIVIIRLSFILVEYKFSNFFWETKGERKVPKQTKFNA